MATCGGRPPHMPTQPTNTYPTHCFLLNPYLDAVLYKIMVLIRHQPSKEEMPSPVWCDHGCLPLQTLTAPAGVSQQLCIFESPV